MKHTKITATIFAFAALAGATYAQQEAPAKTSAAPAAETKAAAPEAEAKSAVLTPDRSYLNDYAGKKAEVVYLVNGKENPATFKEINGKNVVFADSTGADLSVEHGSATFKFALKCDADALRAARNFYARGEWESSILKMRDIVYPAIPLCALTDDAFAAADYVEPFVESLLAAGRLKEAKSFAAALPLDLAPASIISCAAKIADALLDKGDVAGAQLIVEKIELREDSQYAASDAVLKVMGKLRAAGKIKEMLPLYSKFGSAKNPHSDEFKLWGVYCDVIMGNRMSAEVYLNSITLTRADRAFSLGQMIKGQLRATDPKKPDLNAALDLFAEGIVFGNVSSDWMPELLYNTGMGYKTLKKFVASNEIFAQIQAMYPQSPYAKLSGKEFVKVEKKKVEKEISHDDDDDDDD